MSAPAPLAPVAELLEIGPEGTHFIQYRPLAPLLGASVIGLALAGCSRDGAFG